jgi:hypothetical protein
MVFKLLITKSNAPKLSCNFSLSQTQDVCLSYVFSDGQAIFIQIIQVECLKLISKIKAKYVKHVIVTYKTDTITEIEYYLLIILS